MYDSIVKAANSVFDLDARLPARVFRHKARRIGFFEFDDVLDAAFWSTIQTIARGHEDEEVFLLVVEPDPVVYFRQHFHYYGAAQLPVDIVPEVYMETISAEPLESPADALLYNGQIMTFTGPSGGFGIWCERELEVGVIGLFDGRETGTPFELPSGMIWRSVEDAIQLMAPTFRDRKTPEELALSLRTHYQSA